MKMMGGKLLIVELSREENPGAGWLSSKQMKTRRYGLPWEMRPVMSEGEYIPCRGHLGSSVVSAWSRHCAWVDRKGKKAFLSFRHWVEPLYTRHCGQQPGSYYPGALIMSWGFQWNTAVGHKGIRVLWRSQETFKVISKHALAFAGGKSRLCRNLSSFFD